MKLKIPIVGRRSGLELKLFSTVFVTRLQYICVHVEQGDRLDDRRLTLHIQVEIYISRGLPCRGARDVRPAIDELALHRCMCFPPVARS